MSATKVLNYTVKSKNIRGVKRQDFILVRQVDACLSVKRLSEVKVVFWKENKKIVLFDEINLKKTVNEICQVSLLTTSILKIKRHLGDFLVEKHCKELTWLLSLVILYFDDIDFC